MSADVLGPDLCLSGGADGADLMWGMVAGSIGHSVIHWGFEGHKSAAPASETVMLSSEQLRQADPFCLLANRTLKRRFPAKSEFISNLLRRDFFQVRDAQSCYAVAEIEDGMVQGGSAWATQMFIDSFDGAPCPCYVFCQTLNHWFKWEGHWASIYEAPVPEGIYAGIGTRKLQPMGKLAIRILMNWRGMRHRRHAA